MEIEEKSKMVERPKNAAKIIQEFEEIIRSNKTNIVWLAYQRGLLFQKFIGNEKLAKMITKFGVRRSTAWFKKMLIIYLFFEEAYEKEICKENASKFK